MSSAVAYELQELENFLGAKGEIALFRVCDSKPREVYRNAPGKEELGYQSVVGFADAVGDERILVTPHRVRFTDEYRFSVPNPSAELGLCTRFELENDRKDSGTEH